MAHLPCGSAVAVWSDVAPAAHDLPTTAVPTLHAKEVGALSARGRWLKCQFWTAPDPYDRWYMSRLKAGLQDPWWYHFRHGDPPTCRAAVADREPGLHFSGSRRLALGGFSVKALPWLADDGAEVKFVRALQSLQKGGASKAGKADASSSGPSGLLDGPEPQEPELRAAAGGRQGEAAGLRHRLSIAKAGLSHGDRPRSASARKEKRSGKGTKGKWAPKAKRPALFRGNTSPATPRGRPREKNPQQQKTNRAGCPEYPEG